MNVQRRQFLKTTAGISLGSLAASMIPFSNLYSGSDKRARIAIFWEEGITQSELTNITKQLLMQALTDADVVLLTADEIQNRLNIQTFDLLLLPFGSYFPSTAYQSILKYLKSGGNLLNLGGVPFAVPLKKNSQGFSPGIRQVNFHKELGITQSFNTVLPKTFTLQSNGLIPFADELTKEINCTSVNELYYRFADTNDFPNESGTTGTQDALLTPLVWIVDANGEKRSAPIVQIDHLRGNFSGGRWILANYEGKITAEGLKQLTQQVVGGAIQLSASPGYACYRYGELPSVNIQFRYPGGKAEELVDAHCSVKIFDKQNKKISEQNITLQGHGPLLTGSIAMDSKRSPSLSPGLYRIEVSQNVSSPYSSPYPVSYTTGFWIYDESLLKAGKLFTTDGNYFQKDGKTFPVAGTTYMTSDTHRKFLFQPNVWIWNNDFKKMQQTGINMVRTGIWTAWRNYMLDPGKLNEEAMRSLDAFLLTARSYDIPVIFTFFAFLPELWNGENAYLDPRSIQAQKEFVSLIVQRYSMMNDVMWDLINEPSFCSPQYLWSCRPNYDQHEQTAWQSWLLKKYPVQPNETEHDRDFALRQQYRLTANDPFDLPSLDDFAGANILYNKRPLKTIEYKFFAQAMFAQWAKEISETIRTNGNPKQLITVGQDEGGTGDSPSPHFFAETVDFTSIHNWWQNDDLVWDSIMTKVHGKANLVEETGVMFYEKNDGSPRRTEKEAAQLLDRKIAISIGTGGAGFIQWIWNINPLMKNDNEATIGLLRVDGTVKPEYDVVKKYAAFIRMHGHRFKEKQSEEVVIMIPHSQIFSPKNSATEALKRSVRVLTYHFGIPVRAVSEFADTAALTGAKLIIVPSPRTLSEHGWNLLTSAAQTGAMVAINGIIDEDEFYQRKKRSALFSIQTASANIAQQETLYIDGLPLRFSYRGDKIQQLEKAVIGLAGQELQFFSYGKGAFIWSPIPIENSESVDSIDKYYFSVLNKSDISPLFKQEKKDPSVLLLPLQFNNCVLYTLVSESNEDLVVQFSHEGTSALQKVNLPAQEAVLLLLDSKTGSVIGTTSAL